MMNSVHKPHLFRERLTLTTMAKSQLFKSEKKPESTINRLKTDAIRIIAIMREAVANKEVKVVLKEITSNKTTSNKITKVAKRVVKTSKQLLSRKTTISS